jgi:hypothetical protein
MRLNKSFIAAIVSLFLLPRLAFAACPIDRANVRSASDTDAALIEPAVFPATIDYLRTIPPPRPLPQDGRVAPVETTIYSVVATLIAYRLTPEGEIHLVLSDEERRTMTAVIPAVACAGGSRFLSNIAAARATFEQRYVPTEVFREVRQPIEVQGVAFFEFFRGQRGLATNGISLHPVTAIDFTPPFLPKPPPRTVRRRAARAGGGSVCARPTLTITASRPAACAGENVTIAWNASTPSASVTIDGIGILLPASGIRTVTASASTVYSGRAVTTCGLGDEAVAVVTMHAPAAASLLGPSSINEGSSTTLSISVSGASSWSLNPRSAIPSRPLQERLRRPRCTQRFDRDSIT